MIPIKITTLKWFRAKQLLFGTVRTMKELEQNMRESIGEYSETLEDQNIKMKTETTNGSSGKPSDVDITGY